MKSLHDSGIGDFARGGQLGIHFLRMIGQVARKFAFIAIMLYIIITTVIWFNKTLPYERYLAWQWTRANIGTYLENGKSAMILEKPEGGYVRSTFYAVANSPTMSVNGNHLLSVWLESMVMGACVAAGILLALSLWVFKFGRTQRNEQHLRGTELMEGPELASYLRKHNRASELKVAGVPIIHGTETTHILLNGSPGTGKSTTIYELMKRIRERGDRCICYSPSGDFIEWFYREGRDTILNPFDDRSPSWNLWDECEAPYHHDMIASAIIPMPTSGDPFWNTAARTLLAAVTQTMGDRGTHSMPDLLRILAKLELDSLHKYLKGTDAASLMDPASDKTATSIRTTAVTYAKSLKYVTDDREKFSIRKWVQNEDSDGWIFLNARPDQIDSVRPVLSAWLEIFTNSLMSLPASRTRRVWLIVDELPTLNKIPSLSDFLAQARKYGGCGVISFQQMSQLKSKYGPDDALALAGLCATWVCMRQNDPDTAKWVAQSFGQAEVNESNQGLSYGANDMRDGVSLSTQKKLHDVLLPSQISNLDDLEGYIRLPGQVPKAHFKMKRPPIKTTAVAFVPAITSSLDLEDETLDDGAGAIDVGADGGAAPEAPTQELASDAKLRSDDEIMGLTER